MRHLFDTNTFLQAKNDYYPFDICPAFWDWLDLEYSNGTIYSIDAVKAEMRDPDARQWVQGHPAFFEQNDVTRLQSVSTYASGLTRYTQAERTRFLSGADPILIAHALQTGDVLVTQEVSDRTGTRIKIPDVCKHFGVSCINTAAALRQYGARFILDRTP